MQHRFLTHDRDSIVSAELDQDTLGRGTLFELPHQSDGSWGPELIIHNFGQVGDGQNPAEGPTIDISGNIYGTTLQGPGFFGGLRRNDLQSARLGSYQS